MSKSLAQKLSTNLDDALDDVMHELKRSSESLGEGAEDQFSKASAALTKAAHALANEVSDRSAKTFKTVASEAREHPVAAATALAVAAVALVGLVVAARRSKPD